MRRLPGGFNIGSSLGPDHLDKLVLPPAAAGLADVWLLIVRCWCMLCQVTVFPGFEGTPSFPQEPANASKPPVPDLVATGNAMTGVYELGLVPWLKPDPYTPHDPLLREGWRDRLSTPSATGPGGSEIPGAQSPTAMATELRPMGVLGVRPSGLGLCARDGSDPAQEPVCGLCDARLQADTDLGGGFLRVERIVVLRARLCSFRTASAHGLHGQGGPWWHGGAETEF